MKNHDDAHSMKPAQGAGNTLPTASAIAGTPAPPGGKHAVADDREDHLAPIWARHRVVHLFMKLTIYYCAVTAFVAAALTLFPALADYMPVGGAKSLIGDVSKDPFTAIETNANQISTLGESLLWMG